MSSLCTKAESEDILSSPVGDVFSLLFSTLHRVSRGVGTAGSRRLFDVSRFVDFLGKLHFSCFSHANRLAACAGSVQTDRGTRSGGTGAVVDVATTMRRGGMDFLKTRFTKYCPCFLVQGPFQRR